MYHFWDSVIRPVLERSNAKNIVEVGASTGQNTSRLLSYCEQKGGFLHCIDPLPLFNVEQTMAAYGSHFMMYQSLSLEVLPFLKDYDAVLIDGDHNWFTVYHELKAIENSAAASGKIPIIIFA